MIGTYTNQLVIWKHGITISDTNEKTFSSTDTIKGRVKLGYKLVINSKGEEVVSIAKLLTESAVGVNDEINGQVVVNVNPLVDLDGTTQFYEVYLI